jgi:hypothetical protein
MKIHFRELSGDRRTKRLMVALSEFSTVSFPVPVRRLRLAQARAPNPPSRVNRLRPREVQAC